MNTNNNWKGIIEYNSLIPSVHSILHTNHLQQMNTVIKFQISPKDDDNYVYEMIPLDTKKQLVMPNYKDPLFYVDKKPTLSNFKFTILP